MKFWLEASLKRLSDDERKAKKVGKKLITEGSEEGFGRNTST